MSKLRAFGQIIKYWFQGPSKRLLSRIFWEFPQGIAAWGAVSVCLLLFPVAEVKAFEGSIFVRFKRKRGRGVVAFSLGSIVIVRGNLNIGMGELLCLHEYGHCLQSRDWGPLYLFSHGLPSVLSFWRKGRLHQQSWVERDANQRALGYFKDKSGFPGWNPRRFPLKA